MTGSRGTGARALAPSPARRRGSARNEERRPRSASPMPDDFRAPLGTDDAPLARGSWRGLRWTTDPARVASPEEADGIAFETPGDVLRELPGRETLRVALNDGRVFAVKRFRPRSAADAVRGVLAPSKARREFEGARLLVRLGLPVAPPVAFAEGRRDGGTRLDVLVTSWVPGEDLDAWISARPWPHPHRRVLAGILGGFVRRLHDAGLVHRDLHAGNLRVGSAESEFPLTLLDLRTARVRAALVPAERVRALAQLDLSLLGRVTARERLRFLRAYLGAGATPAERKALGRRVARATERAARRAFAKQAARCLAVNRRFAAFRAHGFSGFSRAGLSWPPDDFEPLAPFGGAGARVVKDSAGALSVLFETPGGWIYGKLYRPRRFRERFKDLFRRPRALRAWKRSWDLAVRGVPTPAPLMAAARRRWGLPAESVLFTEGVAKGVALDVFWRSAPGGDRRRAAEALGRVVGTLHRLGFSHRDLKAGNLLVTGGPSPRILVTDLDGLRSRRAASWARRGKDLARLWRSARDDCGFTRIEGARLLKAHARSSGEGAWRRRAAALGGSAAPGRNTHE